MITAALTHPIARTPLQSAPRGEAAPFARMLEEQATLSGPLGDVRLNRAAERAGGNDESSPDDRAAARRQVAAQLVAEAFVRPILAQIREQTFVSDRFRAAPAERRFGPMLDEVIAERIVLGARFPLVDAVERTLTARERDH